MQGNSVLIDTMGEEDAFKLGLGNSRMDKPFVEGQKSTE